MHLNRPVFWLVIFILACMLVALIGGLISTQHGLTRTLHGGDGYERVNPHWPWPYFDGADVNYHDSQHVLERVTFDGTVWQGEPGSTTWRLVHSGGITVSVDGDVIFQSTDHHELTRDEFPVSWDGDSLHLRIEIDLGSVSDQVGERRLDVGLYEPSLWGGWQLIPAHRLYDTPPQHTLAQRENILYGVTHLALVGALLGLGVLLTLWIGRARFWRSRYAWITLGIVLLALVVRYILLLDRAGADEFFFFLLPGSDNYVLMARETLAGESHITGANFAPGNIAWMIVLTRLLGPQLWGLYLANAIVGALSTGVIVHAGRIAFGYRAGVIAGLLAALSPMLIFYHTTLLIASSLASWLPLVLLAGLWALRAPSARRVVLFGFTLGIAALLRPTVVLIGPAFFLALLAGQNRLSLARALTLSALAAFVALLIIAPQTLANLSVGERFLINGNSAVTFYWGMNRDSDGSNERGQAYYAASARGDPWMDAALQDLREDPVRVFELTLRKWALLWSNIDYGNNVNFYLQGTHISPMLNALFLRGINGTYLLLFPALMGLLLSITGPYQHRRAGWFLLWALLFISAATVVFTVFGRMRAQVWPLLCIPAGYTLALALEYPVVDVRRWRRLALAGVMVGLVVVALRWVEFNLPRKAFFYGELPDSAIARQIDLSDSMRLLGFDPVEARRVPGGYVYLTLYWEMTAPHDEDQQVYIQLVDPERGRVTGHDTLIGRITYPSIGTSDWPVGARLRESYLFPIPQDVPTLTTLRVGLYNDHLIDVTMVRLEE